MTDIDVLYTVWQTDGSQMAIDPEEITVVDRAMVQWAVSRRDSWISITSPTGLEQSILASTINSTTRSTAEQRRSAVSRDKALEDEYFANRRDAGFIESK